MQNKVNRLVECRNTHEVSVPTFTPLLRAGFCNDVNIRKAEIEDIKSVFEIQEKHNLGYWSLEDYQSEIANSDSVLLVAESEEKIVGFILARLITTLKTAEIVNFAVVQKYQKRGIGKLLLTELSSVLITSNYKKIELEVREQNLKAINFYLKNKFIKDGIRKNFYQNPIDNAVLMSLNFS
jgi:[ribosomal protein S18]-alanine N-acetyltransferase